jgi:hypothetical protein
VGIRDVFRAIKSGVSGGLETTRNNVPQVLTIEINQATFKKIIQVIDNRAVVAGVVPRMETATKLDVVGESFYQEDLKNLAQSKPGSQAGWFSGLLIAEPRNEHDSNAVAVYLLNQSGSEIDACQVGYLPREVAKQLSLPIMQRLQIQGEVVPVLAGLNGGEASDAPSYGVSLQVFWDFKS